MSKKSQNMDFYLVHSTKGGCGKTTVSLMLAAQLAAKGHKTCMLDLDFKGTGLSHLLFGVKRTGPSRLLPAIDGKPGWIDTVPENYEYWNVCFTNPARDFSEKMLTPVVGKAGNQQEIKFDIAVSDPKQVERDRFIGNTLPTDGPEVNIAIFRFKLLAILKELKTLDYTAVVLDLPPSFDEYTKGIFREFFSKDGEGVDFFKKAGKVYLYLVTSYDVAHVMATKELLKKYTKRPHHRYRRDKESIRIVFNDIFNRAYKLRSEQIQTAQNLDKQYKFLQEKLSMFFWDLELDSFIENNSLFVDWNEKLEEAADSLSDAKTNIMEVLMNYDPRKSAPTQAPDNLLP